MKEAISVLGPPASGKSTLAGLYSERIIQVGEYAHSLPDEHPIKKQCIAHWEANTVFDPQLLRAILRDYPLQEQDWYLLDGVPREEQDIPVIERYFKLGTLIEITVDDNVWLERARKIASNGREERYDSSLSQLLKRKEVYGEKIRRLRPCFAQQYTIDNSGDLETTNQQFIEIINGVFPSQER